MGNKIHIKISLKTRRHNNREKRNKTHPGYHLPIDIMSIKLRIEQESTNISQESTNISYHNGSYHNKGGKERKK